MLLLDSPEEYWFYNLKNVYISNISSFVSGCSNLELFKLSTGSLENLATIESIFYSCSALKSIILPTNKSLKLSLDISNTKIAADEPGTDTNEGFQNIQIWLDENEGGFIKTLFPFKESEANIPTEGVIYVPRTFSDEEVNFLGGLVSEKNWLVAKKEN